MKYQWTDALRKRIYDRLTTPTDTDLPTIDCAAYWRACIAEEVSMTYWRTDLPSYISWLVGSEACKAGKGIAMSLVRSMAHEWNELNEIVSAHQLALERLTSHVPPDGGRTFIDPDAIIKADEPDTNPTAIK